MLKKLDTNYRPDIQALRGIAILLVLLFHAKKELFPLGYLGVDIFFVISGFVITPLLISSLNYSSNDAKIHTKLMNFYKKRFFRLMPSLIATVLFCSVLIFLLAPIVDQRKNFSQGLHGILFIGNLGAVINSGDYFSPNPNPFVHLWSLSVEFQIYLLLPILLILYTKIFGISKRAIFSFFSIVTLVSVFFTLNSVLLDSIYSKIWTHNFQYFSFYSPITRFWQFSIGGLLFLISKEFKFGTNSGPFFVKLLVNLVLLVFVLNITLSNDTGSYIATFSALAVIFFQSITALPDFIVRILKWLGDRSYSIYLIHLPLIYIAKYSSLLGISSIDNRSFQSLSAVVFSLYLGNFFYINFEKKFRWGPNIDKYDLKLRAKLTYLLIANIVFSLAVLTLPYAKVFSDPNLPPPFKKNPWNVYESCVILLSDSTKNYDLCHIGAKYDKQVLLFGDSHAAVFSKLMINESRNYRFGLTIASYSDCPFILDSKGYSQSKFVLYSSSKCLEHNRKLFSQIKSGKYDVIFYAQRGREEDNNRIILSNLQNLNSYKSKLVVLGINPEYLPIDSVLGNIFSSRNQFNNQIQNIDSFWKRELELKNIDFIDIYSSICPKGQCTTKASGKFLFVDSNHLSYSGTLVFEKQILSRIL